MRHLLIAFFLIIASITTGLAQLTESNPVRLYRVGDQIVIADGNNNNAASYPYSTVSVRSDVTRIKVIISGVGTLYYAPALFLTDQGNPYGLTVNSAMNAYLLSVPTSGIASSGATGASIDTTVLATRNYTDTQLTNSLVGALPSTATSLTVSPSLHIYWHTETAAPGEEISIQGAFPANATLHMLLDDGIRYVSLPIISQQTGYIKAKLPSSRMLPTGVYGIFVKSGTGKSLTKYINQAKGYSVNSPDIFAGGPLAISGRNLLIPGYTPTVRFVSQSNGVSLVGTFSATGSDAFKINVTCPLSISVGQVYSIFVNNGLSTTVGETQVIDETGSTSFGVTAIAGTSDLIGLNVGFALRFPQCTTGNSTTLTGYNNRQAGFKDALQTALNNRGSAGGGCVVLPAGVYSYTATSSAFAGIDMPANVALKGVAKNLVNIEYGTGSNISKVLYFDGSKTYAGVQDLTFTNLKTDAGGFDSGLINGNGFYVKNVAWNMSHGDYLEFNGSARVVIQDCDFVQGPLNLLHGPLRNGANSYVNIQRNTIRAVTQHLFLQGSSKVFVEGNVIDRDLSLGKTNVTDDVHKVIINNVKGGYIANNVLKTTNGAVPRNLNDGETILAEQPTNPDFDQGNVSSATLTTLTDASKAWPSTFESAPVVAIVDGLGKGQWRRITTRTATVLTVSSAWSVIPDGTSKYAIYNWGLENVAIVNNSLTDEARGITLYHAPQYRVDVVSNRLTNSGAIDVTPIQEALSATKRKFTPHFNLNITDNYVTAETDPVNGASIGVQVIQHGVPNSWGTMVYNLRVLRNTLIGSVPNKPLIQDELFPNSFNNYLVFHNTGSAYVDENIPMILGSIFADNVTKNVTVPYTLNTGSYHTTITRPILLTTGSNSDSAIPNTAKGSTSTISN